MALNPGQTEQELIADALDRRSAPLSRREHAAEALVGGLYAITTIGLLIAAPPALGDVSVVGAVACLFAMMAALRVEFDTGAGYTVPVQLAFVPLLFVLPLSLVPVAVPIAAALVKLVDVTRGERKPTRLLLTLGNSWFAIGPCVVLLLFGVDSPQAAADTPLPLLVALLAQFACDFGASALREALSRGASLREQLADAWVYGIDAGLAPVGLVTAWALDETPWSAGALVPLLCVLGIFGRERRARIQSLVELNNAYRGTALVLGDVVEADDGYTGEHCRDVVVLSLAVAESLGLDQDRCRNLEFAALLHDVGKVAIPKEIINKPGKLDPDEWQIVKTHTTEGQRMLDRVGGFMSDVGRIVRSHHERWDGGGYPDGLAGEDIPIEARIVAACDTWNAMTTTRSYRAALSFDVAARELRDCAGTQLDPEVVAAVLRVVAPPASDDFVLELAQAEPQSGGAAFRARGVAGTR